MCYCKIIIIICSIIVLIAIFNHSITILNNPGSTILKSKLKSNNSTTNQQNMMHKGNPNGQIYILPQQSARGLDPYYASRLNPEYTGTILDPNVNFQLLVPNGVKPLETFIS